MARNISPPRRISRSAMPNPLDHPAVITTMGGPKHNFSPLPSANQSPRQLLKRPGLGLGTRMG